MFKQFKRLADSARERRKAAHALLEGTHLLAAVLIINVAPLARALLAAYY